MLILLFAGQKQPELSTDTTYGIHPMFKTTVTNKKISIPQPRVSLIDRVSTAEATGFAAEKSLPYALIPDIIALNKSLVSFRWTLNGPHVRPSYKMTYSVWTWAKPFKKNVLKIYRRHIFP